MGHQNLDLIHITFHNREMTKDDYVIILGDFGLIWDYKGESKSEKHWLDWLNDKKFTTLFIDGNHENFERLAEYPVEEWKGGKVHKIRDSVYHLMRGEIFDIDGLRFLAMGGASSHDITDGILEPDDPKIKEWNKDWTKMFRINHRSWWKEEIPNSDDRRNAYLNLDKVDYKVDIVLTHEVPAFTIPLLSSYYKPDSYSYWLQELKENLEFDKWFFGHYHDNKEVNEKEFLLYNSIIPIS